MPQEEDDIIFESDDPGDKQDDEESQIMGLQAKLDELKRQKMERNVPKRIKAATARSRLNHSTVPLRESRLQATQKNVTAKRVLKKRPATGASNTT